MLRCISQDSFKEEEMQKIIMMITLLSSTTCFAFGGFGGLGSLGSINMSGGNKVKSKASIEDKTKKPIRKIAAKRKISK